MAPSQTPDVGIVSGTPGGSCLVSRQQDRIIQNSLGASPTPKERLGRGVRPRKADKQETPTSTLPPNPPPAFALLRRLSPGSWEWLRPSHQGRRWLSMSQHTRVTGALGPGTPALRQPFGELRPEMGTRRVSRPDCGCSAPAQLWGLRRRQVMNLGGLPGCGCVSSPWWPCPLEAHTPREPGGRPAPRVPRRPHRAALGPQETVCSTGTCGSQRPQGSQHVPAAKTRRSG